MTADPIPSPLSPEPATDPMHYADHGVAGGFPHRASDCAGARRLAPDDPADWERWHQTHAPTPEPPVEPEEGAHESAAAEALADAVGNFLRETMGSAPGWWDRQRRSLASALVQYAVASPAPADPVLWDQLAGLRKLSDAATAGPWTDRNDGAITSPADDDGWLAEAYEPADCSLIVATVNYVRALLAASVEGAEPE